MYIIKNVSNCIRHCHKQLIYPGEEYRTSDYSYYLNASKSPEIFEISNIKLKEQSPLNKAKKSIKTRNRKVK